VHAWAFEGDLKAEQLKIPFRATLFINSVLKLPKVESGEEQRSCPHHAKFCFPSAMPYFSVVLSNAFPRLKVLGEIDSCDDFFLSCHINKCFAAQQPLRFARFALGGDSSDGWTDSLGRLFSSTPGALRRFSTASVRSDLPLPAARKRAQHLRSAADNRSLNCAPSFFNKIFRLVFTHDISGLVERTHSLLVALG
jgi:hypothetical protein